MFESSNPKQPFYIANKIDLNPEKQKILTHLYQPLVGVEGVGLYMTLVSEYDAVPLRSDYRTLYQLQDQTMASLKDLFNSLHHLEAVGLVKTYLGSNPRLGEIIIFNLREVPSASEFFHTFLLSTMLQERVGTVAYGRLVEEFTPVHFADLDNAKEVSAGFFDVFHLNAQMAINTPTSVREASEKIGEVSETSEPIIETGKNLVHVDWDFMSDLFASYHIPNSEMLKHRQAILQIMTFYGLNEQEFVNSAITTISAGSTKLNIKAIEQTMIDTYGLQKNKRHIRQQLNQPKKNAQATIQGLSPSDTAFLKEVNETNPIDYLFNLKEKKGGYATASEKRVVYNLQNRYGLSPQLINVLIHTCLEYDSVLTPTLADRIANNWLQKGITTASEAIEYVKNWRKQQSKPRRTTRKTIKKTIDWDKYAEDSKQSKSQTAPKMTEEEMNQIFRDLGKNN